MEGWQKIGLIIIIAVLIIFLLYIILAGVFSFNPNGAQPNQTSKFSANGVTFYYPLTWQVNQTGNTTDNIILEKKDNTYRMILSKAPAKSYEEFIKDLNETNSGLFYPDNKTRGGQRNIELNGGVNKTFHLIKTENLTIDSSPAYMLEYYVTYQEPDSLNISSHYNRITYGRTYYLVKNKVGYQINFLLETHHSTGNQNFNNSTIFDPIQSDIEIIINSIHI